MSAPPAVHATSADLDALSSALADAFADDPVQRWLFAGADDFRASLGRFFQFFVDEYFALGHCTSRRDLPGTAVPCGLRRVATSSTTRPGSPS